MSAAAKPRKRIAVLISGRGSNMEALIAAAAAPDFPGEIVAVLSNRPDARGLETAAMHGIAAVAVDHKAFASRAAHEAAVMEALDRVQPDVVCLAGYMRILSADFTQRYRGRMINIHPSLLPLFPGLDTHARALGAGMRLHGCTVHFVTEVMDEGPIIAQAAVRIEAGDTAETLSRRVLGAEHRLYPHALRLVLDGRVTIDGGLVPTEASTQTAAPASCEMLIAPATSA
ncbi:phosphoribosylglycinamide formyltransferase [Mangrovicella endophytica]|uniref:phosphoribosylglycinamide formyltransferase n=1 Tax=Mangrovicella endophytica TaxID=2066697 RepID=UPI000C9E491A|nr:phosphoribosylglycinamide formyltransferase [Mangrovicella endophytica]